MDLVKIWKKPHPFIFNKSSVLIPFAITFLVLLFFRPFNFAEYSFPILLLWTSVFSLIPVVCTLLVVTLMRFLFPSAFDPDKWTVGKEVLLFFAVVSLIACSVFCLFLVVSDSKNIFQLLQLVLLRTIVISAFPILVLVLYEQYRYQKKQNRDARKINEELLLHQKGTVHTGGATEKIRLLGENQKMALQLDASSLVYVKSEGNYVDVFHVENEKIVKTLVRSSLKDIEEQLPQPRFFRCHRSFIISLLHIQSVSGNARNLEVLLSGVTDSIPVSRTKAKELMDAIEQSPY